MLDVRPPVLVVVTGMPAAGKTTLADALSLRVGLPLIVRDRIKERLYETLGTGDVDWSGKLGDAAFALLFDFASLVLTAGQSVIVEANFFRGSAEEQFRSLPDHRLVQIHCAAPLELLITRYTNRPRHEGHHDAEKVKLLPGRFASGTHDALDLPGDLIRVETLRPVDLDAIVSTIRSSRA